MSTNSSRWSLTADAVAVHRFFNTISYLALSSDMKGIGQMRDGKLVAAALFEGICEHSLWVHLAAEPGGRWLTRSFMEASFGYAFNQLGVKRIYGRVDASNMPARRFDEHIGFKLLTTIPGAASDGGDVLVYVMNKEDCEYVKSLP